jgi:hypothetical protein
VNDWDAGFWHRGARLAISISLMLESRGRPILGALGVIPDLIAAGTPDLPTSAFFVYGYYEGIPRILDRPDEHGQQFRSR